MIGTPRRDTNKQQEQTHSNILAGQVDEGGNSIRGLMVGNPVVGGE